MRGASDFRLQGGSPALNAGIDYLDLDGDASTTDAINIGAYVTGSETFGVDGSSGMNYTGIAGPRRQRQLGIR